MADSENLGSFFQENKRLVKDYFETRMEIYRLRIIRIISKLAGHLVWIIVLLFLASLLLIFLGMVTGFWLSELTGSYAKGFGLTALLVLLLVIIIAALRKSLFINPFIRTIVNMTAWKTDAEEADDQSSKQV